MCALFHRLGCDTGSSCKSCDELGEGDKAFANNFRRETRLFAAVGRYWESSKHLICVGGIVKAEQFTWNEAGCAIETMTIELFCEQ